jgi:outer membrane protein TolC
MADKIRAEGLVVLAENQLKNLITDNYEKWDPVKLEPAEKLLAIAETYDRSQSWVSALTKRPDFNAQKLELEIQGVDVKLAFNQVFPALNVVGSYRQGGISSQGFNASRDSLENNDNNDYTLGVVLSIPLSNRGARNNLRVARERLNQQELQLQSLHQSIVVGVVNAITDAKSSFDQIPARRQARVFAEQALDAEQRKLENGRSTSFEVLTLQRELTQKRLEEIQSLTAYNKSLAELYFQEGTILDRNRIFVEAR